MIEIIIGYIFVGIIFTLILINFHPLIKQDVSSNSDMATALALITMGIFWFPICIALLCMMIKEKLQ